MKLYSIKDTVARSFGTPFAAVNEAEAKRKVAYSYQSVPYAADCDLYFLCDFDEFTGMLKIAIDGGDECEKFGAEMICAVSDLFVKDGKHA